MYPELEAIRASITALEAIDTNAATAYDQAVGVYLNDPAAPTVTALVWRGHLADLKIADSICQLAPTDAAAQINAVMINAFNAWHQDYNRLLGAPSAAATG